MTAANALLASIHRRLSVDPGLTAIVGADGIRDRLLPRPILPCIVFGELETRDYSSDDGSSEEHFLTLEIWSEAEGRRQAQDIAALVHDLLHEAALEPDGAILVNLTVASMRTKREPKTKYYVVELRLRAVTE